MQSTTYFEGRWQCFKRTKDSSGYPRPRDPEFCMANRCPEFHQTVVDQSEEPTYHCNQADEGSLKHPMTEHIWDR